MIAYNPTDLDNLAVREQAEEALAAGCITETESQAIFAAFPSGFYTPNIFIRAGLFLLTVVILLFSVGLLALIGMGSGSHALAVFLVFCGLAAYGILEYMVNTKKHFRSGVDDALMWMAAGLILTGINLFTDIGFPMQSILVFLLSFYCCLRFADRLMGLSACLALMAMLYNLVSVAGKTGLVLAPFLLMAGAAATLLLCSYLGPKAACRHYRPALTVIRIACLVAFYLSGNYYVVEEWGSRLSDRYAPQGSALPLGWLFWLLTVFVPLYYIFRGLRKKDPVFLRTGLVLTAVIIFTVRNYYHVLPAEIAMTIGGALMIVLAYALIRYLRSPKHGFTYKQTNESYFMEKLNLESLVLAETFTNAPDQPETNGIEFGGGSGGGGGAEGTF